MADDDKLERELWDDGEEAHPRIYHRNCGGRVVWVCEEEWRCFKCAQKVDNTQMDIPDEPLLNDRVYGTTTN